MKFIDYDSFLGFDSRKQEDMKEIHEKLKSLALDFKIKIIINQKEQVMDRV
jgi:hypothetical protein